jgi:hypothetical protein
MKKILGVLPVILLLAAGCSLGAATDVHNTAITPAATSTASRKLADQPYASYAYLISTDNLSVDAKLALTGFILTKKKLANGTTQIDLKAQKTEYRNQQYILHDGEQLYLIEQFLEDDQNNQENNLLDDQAIVVDAQGNIVGLPTPFVK